jgi:hypothetical protein
MRSSEEHRWTVRDDIVAFYLSRHGADHLGLTLDEVAQRLDIGCRAMNMRMGNFQYLDGQGGLSHPSQQSIKVFQDYRHMIEPEMLAEVRAISGETLCRQP